MSIQVVTHRAAERLLPHPPGTMEVQKTVTAPSGAGVRSMDTIYRPKLVVGSLVGVAALCAAPLLLVAAGVDFSSGSTPPLEKVQRVEKTADLTEQQLFEALSGALVHSLLEWTAFAFGFCTLLSATVHYYATREVATALFALAFFAAAFMDAMHALVSDRLIEYEPDPAFVPFTWALSRIVKSSTVALTCAVLLYVRRRGIHLSHMSSNRKAATVAAAAGALVVILGCCNGLLNHTSLPGTVFPDDAVPRPYDLIPLALFALSMPLLWMCRPQRQGPQHSVFVFGVLVGTAFDVATQLYMSFGSSAASDAAFNIAHVLKVFSFAVPWFALSVDAVVALVGRNLVLQGEAAAIRQQMVEYVAQTTHDLRTPMNGIMGGLELIREECALPDHGKEYVAMVADGVDLLRHTVENILLFSKAVTCDDDVEPPIEEFNAHAEMLSCARLLSTSMRDGVEVCVQTAADAMGQLRGCSQWLRQIAVNLLGNAAKFTVSGRVTVQLSFVDMSSDGVVLAPLPGPAGDAPAVAVAMAPNRYLRLDVIDTGPGISDADKLRLFRAFVQLEHKQGGTGLGLFSVFKQVSILGGTVKVDDNPAGQGTRFSAIVPVQVVGTTTSTAAPALPASAITTTHGDGQVVSIWVAGARPASACSNQGAGPPAPVTRVPRTMSDGVNTPAVQLSLPHEAAASTSPAASAPSTTAVVAIATPTSCRAAAVATRRRGTTDVGAGGGHARGGSGESADSAASPLVRSVSAGSKDGSPSGRRRGMGPSFRGPSGASVPGLCASLSDDGAAAPTSAGVGHPVRVPPTAPCTFTALAVDDNRGNRKLLRKFLEKAGGDVVTANDGAEALHLMQERAFSIVLCDVQMPHMDGLSCARALRAWEAALPAPVPHQTVVGFTALAGEAAASECADAGMDDVLTKPLRRVELMTLLRKLHIIDGE